MAIFVDNHPNQEIVKSLMRARERLNRLSSGEIHNNPLYQGKRIAFDGNENMVLFDSYNDYENHMKSLPLEKRRNFSSSWYIPRPDEYIR